MSLVLIEKTKWEHCNKISLKYHSSTHQYILSAARKLHSSKRAEETAFSLLCDRGTPTQNRRRPGLDARTRSNGGRLSVENVCARTVPTWEREKGTGERGKATRGRGSSQSGLCAVHWEWRWRCCWCREVEEFYEERRGRGRRLGIWQCARASIAPGIPAVLLLPRCAFF